MQLARRVSDDVLRLNLPEEKKGNLAMGIHYGFGAMADALFGALAPTSRRREQRVQYSCCSKPSSICLLMLHAEGYTWHRRCRSGSPRSRSQACGIGRHRCSPRFFGTGLNSRWEVLDNESGIEISDGRCRLIDQTESHLTEGSKS
jgi:hypothetical protein